MSYLVIDIDGLRVVKRAVSLQAASFWADLLCPDVRVKVCPTLASSFSGFTEDELVSLADSLGHHLPVQPYGEMLQGIKALVRAMDIDETSLGELARAVQKASPKSDTRMQRATALPPATFVPHALTQGDGSPRAPRSARAPSSGKVERPAAGSTTGRVWEVCDQVHAANPGWTNKKDFRVSVINACIKAGINESTAGTQYSKWIRHHFSK
jgi:hypothetical protein